MHKHLFLLIFLFLPVSCFAQAEALAPALPAASKPILALNKPTPAQLLSDVKRLNYLYGRRKFTGGRLVMDSAQFLTFASLGAFQPDATMDLVQRFSQDPFIVVRHLSDKISGVVYKVADRIRRGDILPNIHFDVPDSLDDVKAALVRTNFTQGLAGLGTIYMLVKGFRVPQRAYKVHRFNKEISMIQKGRGHIFHKIPGEIKPLHERIAQKRIKHIANHDRGHVWRERLWAATSIIAGPLAGVPLTPLSFSFVLGDSFASWKHAGVMSKEAQRLHHYLKKTPSPINKKT